MYAKIVSCLLACGSLAGLLPAQDCAVELSVLEVSCDNQGTPDNAADDTYTIVVRVAADNASSAGFFYFSNNDLLEGTGTYGTDLALGPLPLAETPLSLSIVDADNPGCNTSEVIDAPAACADAGGGDCGSGELAIALAQDTVCRGGGALSVTVLAEPVGQPADYSIRFYLYEEPPGPDSQPITSWTTTPPDLYSLTEPNRTYYVRAGSVLAPETFGSCAIFSEVVAVFVSGPDLSYLPEELLLCPGDGVELTVPGANTLGPVQEVIWRRNGDFFSSDHSVFIVDPGEYWVLVRDANNCAEDHSFVVTVGQELPDLMVETFGCGPVVEACLWPELGNDFLISWPNGSGAPCTEFTEPGTYTVTVTDLVVGCSWLQMFEISLSGAIEVTGVEITEIGCEQPGRIGYAVSGGQAPYSFQWSNGATTQNLEGITAPGEYAVTITDNAGEGCSLVQEFNISGTPPLQVFGEQNTHDQCDGAGLIFAFVTGGTPPYAYAWNTGATTPQIEGLSAGEYRVTVTDATGCTIEDAFIIEPGLEVFVNGFTRLDCTTGTATFFASLEGAFSYEWTGPNGFSADTRTVTVSEPGVYSVVVTSLTDPSCVSAASTTITPAEFPATEIEVQYSPECGEPPLLWAANPSNVASYLWTLPSGELVDSTLSLLAADPGWYYLETRWVGQNCIRLDSVYISFTGEDCATLSGRLFADEGNCQLDGTELLVPGWRVQVDALSGSFTTVVLTDPNGNWSAAVPPGNYRVFALPYNNLYLNCSPPAQVNLPNANSTASVDVLMPWIEECPAMWTDLSIPFLRRCFPSQVFVSYCNDGPVVAEDARLVVQLDPYMVFLGADLTPALVTADSLVFEVGDLEPFACGYFAIEVLISCEAELGQTHCASVYAYPDAPCPNPANWNGANVSLAADCDGETLEFQIQNTGDVPMSVPLEYIVIEDGIMMMATPTQSPPLAPGATMTVDLPANGATYHLFTNQEPNAPGAATPTLAVEGCGTNAGGTFSTGFVNQFSLGDGDTPWRDEDCAPNVGAYDPNDKQGFPIGYGTGRFIEAGTRIEYNLRFQNTGTDTAFTVVLRDTLAPELDWTTLRLGSASHAYRAALDTQRVLTVTFDDILLPDSATNPLGSQGILQFSIATRADLEPGTVVNNRAGIFFDFNAPILTNTTLHTIGRDFVQVVAVEQIPNLLAQLEIYPNPSAGPTTVRITGGLPDRYQLVVTDVLGRDLLRTTWRGPVQELELGYLPPGWYVVRLEDEGGKIHRVGRVLLR
jgi:uncharacterized repeat protein (TIGR01451 family)